MMYTLANVLDNILTQDSTAAVRSYRIECHNWVDAISTPTTINRE